MPTALLFVPPLPPATAAPLVIGGLTALARQERQVRRAGFVSLLITDCAVAIADAVHDGDVLLIDAGVVLDDRIVAAMVEATAPAIATWPGNTLGTERIDRRDTAAGIALYPASLVRDALASLGDWALGPTLLRTALAAGATRINLAASPGFEPGLGRDVPLFWAQPGNAEEAIHATDAMLAAAQPGCRDAVQRWLHAPVEDAAVRLLIASPVPADAIMLMGIAIAIAAGTAFATGSLWTGLVFALIGGPLGGIAEKLARLRIEPTRVGGTAIDLAPFGWFVAAAAHFAATGVAGTWPVALPLTGFLLADRIQRRFFRHFTGRSLDTVGVFEQRFGLVAARRDTLLSTWLGFGAFGLWTTGFAFLASYAAASFFVAQWRTFKRLAERR